MVTSKTKSVDSFRVCIEVRKECTRKIIVSKKHHTFRPETWKKAVEGMLKTLETSFEPDCCIIAHDEIPIDRRRKKEHIILKGLGTKWIYLPKGIVDDAINNRMSSCELDFLKKGPMYALRPFFVQRSKTSVFEDNLGNKISFKNDPNKGFQIQIYGLDPIAYQHDRPGQISFKVPTTLPPTLSVSRTIHKMAYLMLCVTDPTAIGNQAIQPVRNLISQGLEKDYLPYGERFISGASPGFSFNFLHVMDARKNTKAIQVVLRVHHMEYALALAGKLPRLPKEYKRADKPIDVRKSVETFSWGFESMSEV